MENLIVKLHIHPIVDHFTIALLGAGVVADILASVISTRLSERSQFLRAWRERLRHTAVQLLLGGAIASVFSYFTGQSEAERLWDTMSPAAQRLLWSDIGSGRFLSHAVLGTYLTYAFLFLAIWRVFQELSRTVGQTRVFCLMLALIATGALLYQGKTGGDLVYEHGVGSAHPIGNLEQSIKVPKANVGEAEGPEGKLAH